MRKVNKPDSDKTTKLGTAHTRPALNAICAGPDKSLITDSIYREAYDTPDGKRSRVEDQLALSYKHKCAYCERLCKADIEHYRPKKKISGQPAHPGYYWLCYEWSNLIPSCATCNREGAKHSHFPILGNRAITHPILDDGELNLDKFKANVSPLIDERPYLLHPEIDDPDDYFEFEVDPQRKGVRIKGFDDDNRGKKTIEICKLNRQELLLDRKANVIDDFVESVNSLFAKFQDNDETLIEELSHVVKQLKVKSNNIEKTHTQLRQYIVKNSENFNKIINPFLIPRQRTLLSLIFSATLH